MGLAIKLHLKWLHNFAYEGGYRQDFKKKHLPRTLRNHSVDGLWASSTYPPKNTLQFCKHLFLS